MGLPLEMEVTGCGLGMVVGRCLREAALLRIGREKGGGRGLQSSGHRLWSVTFLMCFLKVNTPTPPSHRRGVRYRGSKVFENSSLNGADTPFSRVEIRALCIVGKT